MNFPIPQTNLIDISEWEKEEEGLLDNYPRGSLDKVTYRHEGNRYLFKHSWTRVKEQFEYRDAILHQIWVELIAVYVAQQLEVEVPETALALSNRNSFRYGVLSKWFYQGGESHKLGADFLSDKMENYGESQHNLTDILRYSEGDDINGGNLYWAKLLLFDCLIGNTDRHHENWGIIESEGSKRFAPAFDNGIALGFRIKDEDLGSFDYQRFTEKFKLKTPLEPAARPPNIQQVLSFIRGFGLNIPEFVSKLDIDQLAENIEASQLSMNSQLDEEYRLSDARKRFIIDFVSHRKRYISVSV